MKFYNILTVLCLLYCLSSAFLNDGNIPSTTVASQLRTLLAEETNLRQTLETRVQRLKLEAARLNDAIVPCSCKASIAPRPSEAVLFSGTLPAYQASLTTSTVFNFTSDFVNIGTPYDIHSNHFVAPKSGVYGFSLSVYMAANYWSKLQLVKNGQPIVIVRNGHYSGRQVSIGTNFALVNVTAGDEIWPKYVTSSSRNIWADGVTTFSGVLIHEF